MLVVPAKSQPGIYIFLVTNIHINLHEQTPITVKKQPQELPCSVAHSQDE